MTKTSALNIQRTIAEWAARCCPRIKPDDAIFDLVKMNIRELDNALDASYARVVGELALYRALARTLPNGLVPWLGMTLSKEQPFARDDKGRSFTPQGSGFEYIQRRTKELVGATKYWTPGLAKRVEGWIVIDAPDVDSARITWQQRRLVRGSALTYAQGGWPVIPLYDVLNSHTLIDGCSCEDSACKTPGQHPRVPLESASRDRETIAGWFDAWPDCNLGLRLDTLAIVEVIPEAGGRESFAALEAEHGTLRAYARQDTGKCATGRGWNYLFLAVDGIKTVRNFRPGLSFLTGPLSFIMVSPSEDVNLNRYKWLKPWPEIEANTAPPLWLLDVVRGNK